MRLAQPRVVRKSDLTHFTGHFTLEFNSRSGDVIATRSDFILLAFHLPADRTKDPQEQCLRSTDNLEHGIGQCIFFGLCDVH